MKKYILSLSCLLASLIYFNSCLKCTSEVTYINISPIVEEYFGAYKTGNFWVFKSNKGILDTLTVSDFKESNGVVTQDCTAPRLRECVVESKVWIREYSTIKLFLSNTGTSSSNVSSLFALKINSTNEFTSAIDTFKNTIPLKDTLSVNNRLFKKLLPITGGVYDKTLFFIAPNIGIVRWENKKDTFSLIDFKIN